jgi:hypothetical protein
MRYWPKEIFEARPEAENLAFVSAHESSTRALEDDVKNQPIPRWVICILGATAVLNLAWVYWLAILVF